MDIKDKKAEYIISKLHDHGFRSFIVGGAVRDFLRNVNFSDYDILTEASIDQIIDVFRFEKVKIIGQSFRICLVNNIEISPSRSVCNDDFPAKDLEMRDFTINSMAYDPIKDNIIDLFGGKNDLDNKILRFTENPCQRIKEDPLRIIRACRMTSLINGSIEPLSKKAIIENKYLVKKTIPFERIRLEIIKAMKHHKPSLFFQSLHEIDVLKYIFFTIEQCFDLDGGPFHGETVFDHCMMTGDAISAQYPMLRLAGFLHDTGKFDAATSVNGRLSFKGHENYTDKIRNELEKLRFSNKEINYILCVIHVHMRPLNEDTTPKAVRKILRDLNRVDLDFHDFLRIRLADRKANLVKKPYTFFEIRLRLKKFLKELFSDKNRAFCLSDLEISGNQIIDILNISEGKKVGDILNYLLEKVLENPDLNNKKALEKLILEYRL